MPAILLPGSSKNNGGLVKPGFAARVDRTDPFSAFLVGCYLLNEGGGTTVRNLALGGRANGTFATGVAVANTRTGKGLSFNGAADTNVVTTTNETKLNLASGFTIETWVLLNATGSARVIAGKGTGDAYVLYYDGVHFSMDIQTNTVGPVYTSCASATSPAANTWYHVVGTWDGTTAANALKIYVNGKVDGQATPGATMVSAAGTAFIFGGGADSVNDPAWNGLMDLLRVWERAASTDYIGRLYTKPYLNIVGQSPRYITVTAAAAGLSFAISGAPTTEAEGAEAFSQSGLSGTGQGAPTTGYSGAEQFTAGGTTALPGAAPADSAGVQAFSGGGSAALSGAPSTDSTGVQAFALPTQTLAFQGAAPADSSGVQAFAGGSNSAIAGAASTDSGGVTPFTTGGSAALQGAASTGSSGVISFSVLTQTFAISGAPADSQYGAQVFNNPVGGTTTFAIQGAPSSESSGVTASANPTGSLAFQGAPADTVPGGLVFASVSTAVFKGASAGEGPGASSFSSPLLFTVAGASSNERSGVGGWSAPFSPTFAIKGAPSSGYAGNSGISQFIAATVSGMRGSSSAVASYQGSTSRVAGRSGTSFQVSAAWVGGSIRLTPYSGGSTKNK